MRHATLSLTLLGGLSLALLGGGCRALVGVDDLLFDRGSEDCGNGADDDANGLIDCADPACAAIGFACAAAPPSPWQGPAILLGDPGGVSACPATHPEEVFRGATGATGAQATCTACTCGEPDETCALDSFEVYSKLSCKGQSSSVTATPGQCEPVQDNPVALKAKLVLGEGKCTPSGGEETPPTPAVKTGLTLACRATAGGGCDGGEVCASASAAAGRCVFQTGDHACPAGFPQKRLVGEVKDTRGCAPCACAPAAACAPTLTLYSDGSCQNKLLDAPGDGACLAQGGVGSVLFTVNPPSDTACAPSGGEPAGAIALDPVKTFCCAP